MNAPNTDLIAWLCWMQQADDFHPRRVIDIGAGDGCNAEHLMQRFPGMEVLPFDLAPASALVMQKDVTTSWPVADGTADLIIDIRCLTHIDPQIVADRVMPEVRRCLRPGGIFYSESFTVGPVTAPCAWPVLFASKYWRKTEVSCAKHGAFATQSKWWRK